MKKLIINLAIVTTLFAFSFTAYSQQAIEVCADGPVTLMAGNFQYGTIQWENSVDNIRWEAIPNAYDTIYVFTPEASMYYRVVNKQFNCLPAYSQITFVQVPPTANAGFDRILPGNEVTLFANMEDRASGTWSVISGSNGSFSDSTDNNAIFQGSEPEYTLVWTLTNACGISHDTLNISFRQNTYAEEIVVVDETDSILSTSEQMEGGLYIIAFNNPVPTIGDGTYLVGIPDGGFLRKVESFTVTDSTYSMQTTQATLGDITSEGAFDFGQLFSIDETIQSTTNQTLKSASMRGDYNILHEMPTRKELLNDPKFKNGKYVYIGKEELVPLKAGILFEKQLDSNNQPLFNFKFMDVKIAERQNGLFKILLNGNYAFTPNMVADIDYSMFSLDYFKMGLDNALEEVDVNLKVISQLAYFDLIDTPFSLFSVKRDFKFIVNGLPVIVEAKVEIKGEVSANVGAAMSFDYGYNRKKYFTANIEYANHNWSKNFLNPPPVITEQFNLSVTGNATQSFKIGPEVTFKLYKIIGPYIGLNLKQEANICAILNQGWDASFELGGELILGAKAGIMDYSPINKHFSWEQGFYSYKFPYSLEIVSGNNQTYVPGQALTHNAKIKVLSNKGVQLPLARVVFEPLNGGSVSSGVVYADDHGFAETSWTPGGTGNSQLRVSVLDCQGRHIQNSPLTFNATTATTNCSQSSLSLALNKSGNTIQPRAYLGVAPYTYSTDDVSYQSTAPVVRVTPGNLYTFYVKDANECIASKTYNEDTEVTPTLALSVMVSGNTVEAQAQGGKPPYVYSLNSSTSGFISNNVFNNVSNGQHTVYARDANNTLVSKGVSVNYQSSTNEFTDSRDGNTYQTVTIGSQNWMAENLAYLPNVNKLTDGSEDAAGSYYYVYSYNGQNVNTAKANANYTTYGVLYNWTAAMAGSASSSSNPSGVQGVCPTGWHLPSDAEWNELTDYLINNGYGYEGSGDDIGKSMAATSGWTTSSTPGTVGNDQISNNSTGFTGHPGGGRFYDGSFDHRTRFGHWWSSTESTESQSHNRYLRYFNKAISGSKYNKGNGFSVRCLKNSGTSVKTPTVTTSNIFDITQTSVIGGGHVTADGGAPITARGVCWNITGNPTITDSKTTDGTLVGTFSSNITGLIPETLYYVRAYASNSEGTAYGDEKQFTKSSEHGTGTFTDPRDGNEYQWVKIGSQTWMAKNLAYLPSVSPSLAGSDTEPYYYVYDYEGTSVSEAKATANYTTYGVLYNWPAAMAGSASSEANPSGVQGVCPTGWHLPANEEWTILTDYLTNHGYCYEGNGIDNGKSLAATSGWITYSTPGTVGNDQASNNSTGFTALPGGNRDDYDGGFYHIGEFGIWWSATGNSSTACYRSLYYRNSIMQRDPFGGHYAGFSVRCVRD